MKANSTPDKKIRIVATANHKKEQHEIEAFFFIQYIKYLVIESDSLSTFQFVLNHKQNFCKFSLLFN